MVHAKRAGKGAVEQIRELILAEDILDTVNAHQAMLTALEAGDAEAYREAVHEHYRPLGRTLDAAGRAAASESAR